MSKCTECKGRGHVPSYNPDTGVYENMFCYACRGTGKELDGSFMESPEKQDKTWYTDMAWVIVITLALFGFFYWLFKYVWV